MHFLGDFRSGPRESARRSVVDRVVSGERVHAEAAQNWDWSSTPSLSEFLLGRLGVAIMAFRHSFRD
jgi:hypothetical protein